MDLMFSFQGVSPEPQYLNLKRKPRGAAEDPTERKDERSAEEVAPVRRNLNSGKENCREAEYQDRGKPHGNRRKKRWKDWQRSTHCEGKPW